VTHVPLSATVEEHLAPIQPSMLSIFAPESNRISVLTDILIYGTEDSPSHVWTHE
jgi:hypothetical protein